MSAGTLSLHADNTKPSFRPSTLPSSLHIQQGSLEEGKATCWPHTHGRREHNTISVLPLTSQPSNWKSQRCSRMVLTWSFHTRAHHVHNTKPFFLQTIPHASWTGLRSNQMALT